MMAEAFWMAAMFGVSVLILRRTYPGLTEIIQRYLVIIPPEVGKWNEQKKTWTLRNGGRIVCGNLDHEKDVRKYSGQEFALIAWDELTQFTEWQYRRLFHPLRVATSHPGYAPMKAMGIEPYYIAGTNPGDIGHGFVKERFIDPAPPMTVWRPSPTIEEPKPGTRIFIPSSVTDNPFIAPEYKDQLDMLPEEERRMIRDGDWDVYSGQYFQTFRRDLHVIDPDRLPIPLGGVEKAMGIDFGVSNPFACVWGAVMADGQIVIYRELKEEGVIAEKQPGMIMAMEANGERSPNRPIVPFLDPAAWQREANSPAPTSPNVAPRESAAWHYSQNGLPCRRADNRRVVGWQEIKRLLEPNPMTGKPGLVFYNTCTELIKTLPTLPRDKINPEDINTKSDDHLADALRYLVMGIKRVAPHESKGRDELKRINQASAIAAIDKNGGWRT